MMGKYYEKRTKKHAAALLAEWNATHSDYQMDSALPVIFPSSRKKFGAL
jgi:hypothetical protein